MGLRKKANCLAAPLVKYRTNLLLIQLISQGLELLVKYSLRLEDQHLRFKHSRLVTIFLEVQLVK
jgi:hypothetical protein